jgi:hypothetical protein
MCFFSCFFLLLLLLYAYYIIVDFLFLFLYPFSFLCYQLYHNYLPIPTPTHFTLPLPVLQSIDLLPTYSFCHFPSTLSPFSPSPLILPQPVTRAPHPCRHSPSADQPTIPTLHNPKPLQSLSQPPYTTTKQLHPNTQGPQNPVATTPLLPLTHLTSHLPS